MRGTLGTAPQEILGENRDSRTHLETSCLIYAEIVEKRCLNVETPAYCDTKPHFLANQDVFDSCSRIFF